MGHMPLFGVKPQVMQTIKRRNSEDSKMPISCNSAVYETLICEIESIHNDGQVYAVIADCAMVDDLRHDPAKQLQAVTVESR